VKTPWCNALPGMESAGVVRRPLRLGSPVQSPVSSGYRRAVIGSARRPRITSCGPRWARVRATAPTWRGGSCRWLSAPVREPTAGRSIPPVGPSGLAVVCAGWAPRAHAVPSRLRGLAGYPSAAPSGRGEVFASGPVVAGSFAFLGPIGMGPRRASSSAIRKTSKGQAVPVRRAAGAGARNPAALRRAATAGDAAGR